MVNRIDERLRPAAIRVAVSSLSVTTGRANGNFRNRTLEVRFNDNRINAFVGGKIQLDGLLGGLYRP